MAASALNAALDPAAAAHQQLRLGAQLTETGDAVVSLRAMSGGFVLMGTIEGALMSWSLPTNRRVQRLALLDRKNDKNACLSCMDVSQGDANAQTHLVAAGLSSGRVILADSRTGDRVQVWDDFTQRVSALAMPAFSQQLFASAYDGVFQVRNLEANVVQHQYCACQCPITSMQPVASAVHEVIMGTSSGHTRVLDLRARQVAAEWSVNNKEEVPIRTLCVDDDPNKVHVAFGNGHLQCWDRRSYGSGPTWQRHFVHNDSINVLLCENGKLYSGADDRRVNMLSSSDGAQIDSLQNINHAVTSMLLSDGELFVAGTGKGVRRYDIAGLNASLDAMAAAKVEAQKHAAEEAERLRLEAETAEAEKDKKKDKKDKGGKDDGKKKKKK